MTETNFRGERWTVYLTNGERWESDIVHIKDNGWVVVSVQRVDLDDMQRGEKRYFPPHMVETVRKDKLPEEDTRYD